MQCGWSVGVEKKGPEVVFGSILLVREGTARPCALAHFRGIASCGRRYRYMFSVQTSLIGIVTVSSLLEHSASV